MLYCHLTQSNANKFVQLTMLFQTRHTMENNKHVVVDLVSSYM